MDIKHIIPAVIIWQENFEKIPLWDLDCNNKEQNSLTHYEDELKKIVNYTWGNTHRFLQIMLQGHLFAFHVYYSPAIIKGSDERKYYWEIHIWDATGSATVTNIGFEVINKETDTIPTDVFNKIISACENHVRGIHICSGCGKETKVIAGTYFAGQYCPECWESKYKAIEARETYN